MKEQEIQPRPETTQTTKPTEEDKLVQKVPEPPVNPMIDPSKIKEGS